jgi:hypothetical protein
MDGPSRSSSPVTLRSVEYRIEIAAPSDVVWKAITDAKELERWFPLTASVTPGVGGALTLPGKRPHVIHDFTLEDHGTKSVLRLVAHGFDPNAEWDAFFDGVARGWRYELESLRHYLENHRGRDRVVAWVRTPLPVGAERAWATLFAAGGWHSDAPVERKRRGDRYSIAAPGGTALTGTVVISDHPKDFTGTAEGPSLNNAFLRTQVDTEPDGLVLGVWLEAWGVPATTLAAIEAAWQPALDNLFNA